MFSRTATAATGTLAAALTALSPQVAGAAHALSTTAKARVASIICGPAVQPPKLISSSLDGWRCCPSATHGQWDGRVQA